LHTVARYHKSERADAVLEGIREGSIGSYSFSGSFKRSDPSLARGYKYTRGQTVRRIESTLREYGPTPFPAYAGASIVGVRAEQAAMLLNNMEHEERQRLVVFLQSGAPLDQPDDSGTSSDDEDLAAEPGTPSDDGPAAGDQPSDEHSTRSPRQIMQARRARFIIEHGEPNA
jgi:hypothetical protein